MPLSSRLELPYLEPAQAQKHVTHNEALRDLDMLVQMSVDGFDENTPPALPTAGQIFALGAAPTGDWAGQANMLALREEAGWHFVAPRAGWGATLTGSTDLRIWTGTAWTSVSGQTQNLDGLGVNTSSDPTNRLAVSAAATLLTHEGSDHRLTINKATDTDTGSLVFQSGWTGHAEMGLAGGTGFSIKVSPDGSTWTDALSLDASGQGVTGSVVQNDAYDTTYERLLKLSDTGAGSFGMGATGAVGNIDDWDDHSLASGLYLFSANTANWTSAPAAYASGNYGVVQVLRFNANNILQMVWRIGGDLLPYQRRYRNGVWTDWETLYVSTNILGTVSQSGGIPSGAVLEQGSNANGTYLRLADGTQICTNDNAAITTAPASFTGAITKIDGDKLWLGRWY
jgi:hypothetical protein